MSAKQYPSVEYLRQCFRYEDGKLFWLERPREHFQDHFRWRTFSGKFPGKEAGCRHDHYWVVRLDRTFYPRHLIVWALHLGLWRNLIDHKNRDYFDDTIDNLRPATQSQNMANRRKGVNNTSGYKGVCFDKSKGRWQAGIGVGGKIIYLGRFDTPEEAHAAYCAAAQKYYGEFAFGG